MRRSTPILGVLLGASLLANVLLASRLSRRVETDTPAAGRAATEGERVVRNEDTASLRDSLEAERKKVEELKAVVVRLETDKKVLAQDVPATPGRAEKLARFREKLRKLLKLMKDPAAQATVDPENMVELTEVMMEFYKLAATRSKDPKGYADYLQAFYEVGLEGEGTALSPDQSQAISKLLQDLGEGLGKIPPAPAGDKLMKEIELEASLTEKLKAVLTPAQREAITTGGLGAMTMGNMMSTSYVQKQGGADQIAAMWSAAYQLDAAQQPQVKAAAQSYLDALGRLETGDKKAQPFDQTGSPEGYQRRLQSVREQIAALTLLQGSLTPAQQERIRTQSMREFVLFDSASFQGGAAEVQVERAPKDK